MAKAIAIRSNGVKVVDDPKEEENSEQIRNIYTVFDVDIRDTNVDKVLQLVCAWLNSKLMNNHKFKLRFNIADHAGQITSHEFEVFYKKIETKLEEKFDKAFCGFIEKHGDCDSEQLELTVKKSPKLFSLRNYLYIPNDSSVSESPFDMAVTILRQTGDPGTLPQPLGDGSYKMGEKVVNLRQESVNVQFKTINTEINIEKNMADHLKYISAFANKDGGCLYFGIEDNDGRVVGVNAAKEKEIEQTLVRRIQTMILASGHQKERTLKRGVHWDIKFFKIDANHNFNELSVAKFNSSFLKCKRDESLECISQDGKNLGTFRKIKNKKDEQEQIGFVDMKSVTNDNGEIYKFNSQKPERGKEKFDMSYRQCDVLEFITDDPDEPRWCKMRNIISKKEFSMPKTHLKEEERKIIVITVAKIPGGVLTACPMSYYADNEGNVQMYTFPQWKVDMLKSRPEPCNIEIWDLERNLVNTKNDDSLKQCMEKPKCVILKGLIGTGKTSLALKYCLNFKEENPLSVVWKFKCSSIELLQESMDELLHQMATSCNRNMSKSQTTDIEKIENMILNQLECIENAPHTHILLFDGVKSITKKAVQRFSKKCMYFDNIKVIITTLLAIEITDSIVIAIIGLSPTEADNFFKINSENEGDGCKKLAKMLSYNPLALCIAKAYMTKCRMTFNRMVEVLDIHGWFAIENSKITKDEFDYQPLTTLVRIIGELEESYKKTKNTHIFEMFLMLQFLEAEDIPAFLFYNMFDTLKVNDFLYEVEHFSLGFRKGSEDDSMLTVNHMAVKALRQCTKEKQQIESLTKLIRSLFLSMDKDNNNKESHIRHKALSPHARKVINYVNELLGCKNMTKEFQMHFIFVSDVISNTKDMQLNNAQHLFSLLKIKDPFDKIDTNNKTVNISKVQLTANKILASMDDFLRDKSNNTATESVGKYYLLNKYRNIEDRENLCKILSKQHLEKESQLVEAEYNVLCQKSVAVPHKDIGPLFLYELVICILHSYGKMSFQETDCSLSTMSQKNYLHVAYILSNKITPGLIELFQKHDEAHERSHVSTINLEQRKFDLNSLATILIERSLLKLEMKEMADGKETVSAIQKNIDICNERLNETKHYLEFGVFKVDTKFCQHNKFRWMEHIISLCNKLIKVDSSSYRHRVMEECENLKTHIKSMRNNTYKIELQFAIGTLYFDMEEVELADALFDLLHQNIKCIPDDDRTPNYTNLLHKSTVYYISCRNKRKNVGHDFHIKTETMLKTSLMDFQLNKNITDELQKLSQELEKIKRAYPTWR